MRSLGLAGFSLNGALVVAIVIALGGFGYHRVSAHAGARSTDPAEGATLGDTPTYVQLSFSERPEASLSTIRVADPGGAAYQIDRPEYVPGDPLSIRIRVRPLARGVYVVNWRAVSAVDGHATNGAYAFGVRVDPAGTATTGSATTSAAAGFEAIARLILIAGLVILFGAASATVARFGGSRDVLFATAGCALATIGVVLLAAAQQQNASASFADLLRTPVGRALIWRAVAIAAAALALLLARVAPHMRRAAMLVVAFGALAAMLTHVAAGHAAAGGSLMLAGNLAAQWAHFAAVGIWIGGLAALLAGIRGAPSVEKTAAVRRFSTIAAVALLIVVSTGIVRALAEVASWDELIASGYGRALLAKMVLLGIIAALGAINRWRSVPVAITDLGPLRRTASAELVLASGALAAAALLGTLAPPSSARSIGLTVSGVDFGTTVRVHLTTGSEQPGPNRFILSAVDYDAKTPVRAKRVSLMFTPLDDPGVSASVVGATPGSSSGVNTRLTRFTRTGFFES